MKRSTGSGSDDVFEAMTTANYLMLLSGGHEHGGGETITSRVFECKTCNRQFPSFQALGGHRASHKKPRLTTDHDSASSPPKPKTHECTICGLEFPIGQALGGHMRRHRSTVPGGGDRKQTPSPTSSPPLLSLSPPILKRSNSRRAMCLDLNLTPLENKYLFGIAAPAVVDCFF